MTEADELEHGKGGEDGEDGIGAAEKSLQEKFSGQIPGLEGWAGSKAPRASTSSARAGRRWPPSRSPAARASCPGGLGRRPAEAQGFLDALGDKVTGKFGSGTVFKTRLVNALLTDDGKVYVGAVTKDELVRVANGAK